MIFSLVMKMICNECNRVFSFYQNSRFYLQVAFSSASKLKWMQNERGGKTSEQASRSQKFGVTVKSREKSRGLVSNARIRCTQKKQQPSTTGASRIYGRALLSLSFSLSLSGTAYPAGVVLRKSETCTRGLRRYIV